MERRSRAAAQKPFYSSAIPRDTYFPNVWDDSPSKNRDRATSSSSGMTSETDATSTEVSTVHADTSAQTLFSPPPVPDIPQMLLQLGHYRNVTGPPTAGGAAPPAPDRTKVKRVFPWEERPRASPGRVFPKTMPLRQGQYSCSLRLVLPCLHRLLHAR